jgi:uncharacterized membrane protein required for colicin V production
LSSRRGGWYPVARPSASPARSARPHEETRVDLLTRLSWIDLAIIVVLAGGVFVGFTQGAIRYLLNSVGVLVAFVLAAQLKGPLVGLLGFWTAFSPAGRELLVFVLLFFGLVIAAWFTTRAVYRRTRLPVPRQLDELAGALLGLLWVALLITFHLVVYDSYFVAAGAEPRGWVGAYWEAMNGSLLVDFFRESLLPIAGFLVRPFVPDPIARLLGP